MKLSHAITAAVLMSMTVVTPALAAFDPGYIISEQEMADKDSLSQADIQAFLARQPGTLASYMTENKEGVVMITAQAFYNIAQAWGISPKFLLTLVQKEQSLVTDPAPKQRQYDWATGYAVCDGCSTDDPAIQRWRGFYKQVNSAAAQFEYYLDHPEEFRFKAGQTYTIDDTSVTIRNVATAAMYNYTPHLHGNQNFTKIWNEWFTKHYPDGSLVRATGEAGVWYLQYGTRRPIKSQTALMSRFGQQPIIEISAADLASFPVGWPINLPNYSLVKSPQNDIYLIDGDQRRRIASMEVFKAIGWNPEEVVDVSGDDISGYFEGSLITTDSVFPQGLVAQDTTNSSFYFIKDGEKKLIATLDVRKLNFGSFATVKKTSKELATYPTVDGVIILKDGLMVKGSQDPKVYIISGGQLRWIPDEKTFNALGYNWKNLVVVSQATLDYHQMGEPLESF